MAERMREVVGAHSTWYVCDEHGWDFTNEDEDTCPVCKGEAIAEERIIKLLEGLMNFETDTERRIDHKLALQVLKDALIKGEK